MTAGDGSIWVATEGVPGSAGQLFRIDPETGQTVGHWSVGVEPEAVAVVGSSVWVANTVSGSSSSDPYLNTVLEFSMSTGGLVDQYSVHWPQGLVGVNGQAWAVGFDSSTDTTGVYRLSGSAPTLLSALPGMPAGEYSDNPVSCGSSVYVATILDTKGELSITSLDDSGAVTGTWIMAEGDTSLACLGTQVVVDIGNVQDGGLFLLDPSTVGVSPSFGAPALYITTLGTQIWAVTMKGTSAYLTAVDSSTRQALAGVTPLSLPPTSAEPFLTQLNGDLWVASGSDLFKIDP